MSDPRGAGPGRHRAPRRLAALAFAVAAASTFACDRGGAIRDAGRLPDEYVLEGATLIDGTGGPPIPNARIVVRRGTIARVGSRETTPMPSDARVVPLRGRWIIPGLIDTHAHVTTLLTPADPAGTAAGPTGAASDSTVATADSARAARPRYDRGVSEQVLRTLLAYGVTTVRNPAAPTQEGIALRDAVARGDVPGPRILTAGRSLAMGPLEWTPPHVEVVQDLEHAREAVRRQAAAGVDWIKIYASLTPPMARAVIQEAHAHRLRVLGHLERTTWTEAARLGIDAIAHGAPWTWDCLPPARRAAYRDSVEARGGMKARIAWLEWLEPEGPEVGVMVEALVRHRVALEPTLIAYHTKFWHADSMYARNPANARVPALPREWARGTYVDDWSPEEFRRARAAWPKLLALVKRYDDAGVLLTAGSDEPNPWVVPGEGLHRELALLVDAGIAPSRVIAIATGNAARALGIEDRVGTLRAGKRADLVVLRADPLADIRNTRSIEMVVQRGKRVAGRLEGP